MEEVSLHEVAIGSIEKDVKGTVAQSRVSGAEYWTG